jgi:UDP-N-acetylmuramoyl-tripeptide--D-alanyl-D-alanine ligase
MSNLQDLQQAIGGALHLPQHEAGKLAAQPLGPVVTDSRHVQPGCVFWALAGTRYDGGDFVEEAFAAGASGAVVRRPVDAPAGCWALQVPDTLLALWQWAAWKRQQFRGTVIAVTGSVGKTTPRQMIHTVLRTRLRGCASPRNYNNHVGLPLSMFLMEPEHEYAVLELGASSRGEIAAMADLCGPQIGVITQIGDAHLGTFGGRRQIAESKAELLGALPQDGHAVLGDDPWLRRVARWCKAPVTWVGRGPECDVTAAEVNFAQGKLTFRVADCPFEVPVWGRHHLLSAMIAVAVGRLVGISLEEAAAALAGFDGMPMRCEVIEARGATIINDAYNASPTAMQAALELLRDFETSGRRIVVCGDMAELGSDAPLLHAQLGNQVVTLCGADLLIACGEHAGQVVAAARAAGMPHAHAIPCRTPEDALPYLGQAILPGDVVLVKGSRVVAMERIVDALHNYPRRRSA